MAQALYDPLETKVLLMWARNSTVLTINWFDYSCSFPVNSASTILAKVKAKIAKTIYM